MYGATTLLALALGVTALPQAATGPPAGYKTVYITSMVDQKMAVVPKSSATGSTIVIQKLANTPAQQWYLKEGNSSIQLAGSSLCLDGGAQSNWKDMASIYVKTCDSTATSQVWDVMTDGRIALAASSPQECLDLQYMRDTVGNPVGLYSCKGLGGAGAGDKGINWPLANATSS